MEVIIGMIYLFSINLNKLEVNQNQSCNLKKLICQGLHHTCLYGTKLKYVKEKVELGYSVISISLC